MIENGIYNIYSNFSINMGMHFHLNLNQKKIMALLLVSIITINALSLSFDKTFSNFAVAQKSSISNSNLNSGKVRTYYIAADEVPWNYAPSGKNLITGKPFDDNASVYVKNGQDRIGSTYIKAVYREYTDNTFTHLKPRPPQWQHLGILGPVIHAEVGDTIKVVFKNNAHIPYSMHPHGVFYSKSSEGAPYNDGVNNSQKAGDAVQPGKIFTYIWQVPERAGPGPGDPNSVMWMYHSHVNEVSDTNSGLVGPIIITRHGEANPDGTPKGVNREFVVLYTIFDENKSHYLGQNIKKYAGNASSVNPQNDSFVESNLKHSINGFVFGNLKGLDMKVGEKVRWYMMGMGSEDDIHVPHWHGNTLLYNGMRTDTVQLMPMTMAVLDMVPDDPGTWLFHCSVNDHILAGMLALYTVT